MENVTSKILIKILSEDRTRFNTAFAMAKHTKVNLDGDQFLEYFARLAGPLAEKFKNRENALVSEMIVDLYDIILELCAKDFLGSRGKFPGFEECLFTITDHFSNLMFESPRDFIGSISNALINIMSDSQEMARVWTRSLVHIPPDAVDVASLLNCGLISAWCAGLAKYRGEALGLARNAEPRLFAIMFGLEEEGVDGHLQQRIIDTMEHNPWVVPAEIITTRTGARPVLRMYGSFKGFGGLFSAPPQVFTYHEKIIVQSGGIFFELFADVYGQNLVRTDKPGRLRRKRKRKNFSIDEKGFFSIGKQNFQIPENMRLPLSSSASIAKTHCFTSPLSHRIFIIGMKDGAE